MRTSDLPNGISLNKMLTISNMAAFISFRGRMALTVGPLGGRYCLLSDDDIFFLFIIRVPGLPTVFRYEDRI